MTILLILALLVAGGGSASYVAESALPGDALYAVKTNVNENIRAALSFSTEAKADWETKRVERRLEEAEQLALEGRLNVETKAKVEANFKAHLAKSAELRSKLESKNNLNAAANVNSNIENLLKAHEQVLIKIKVDSDEDVQDAIQDLLDEVRVGLQSALEVGAQVDSKIMAGGEANVESAAKGKLEAATNKVAEVKKYLENFESKLSAEIMAEAKAKLASAENLIAEGKVKLDAKAYADAFIVFKRAHSVAQEAKTFVLPHVLEKKGNTKVELKAENDLADTSPKYYSDEKYCDKDSDCTRQITEASCRRCGCATAINVYNVKKFNCKIGVNDAYCKVYCFPSESRCIYNVCTMVRKSGPTEELKEVNLDVEAGVEVETEVETETKKGETKTRGRGGVELRIGL